MEDFIKKFQTAQQEIYDHIGFVEDWVPFVIDFRTNYFWEIGGYDKWGKFDTHCMDWTSKGCFYKESIRYADDLDSLNEGGGDLYEDEIFHHRFYPKAIYRGEKYTGIIVDTHTDGNRFLAIYDNEKEIK